MLQRLLLKERINFLYCLMKTCLDGYDELFKFGRGFVQGAVSKGTDTHLPIHLLGRAEECVVNPFYFFQREGLKAVRGK